MTRFGCVIEAVRESIPDVVFWEPHYGDGGRASALRNRATLHQWTSSFACPGFAAGIDANEILEPDQLRSVCGLPAGPAPHHDHDDQHDDTHDSDRDLTSATLWRHAEYADLFLIGMGPIVRGVRGVPRQPHSPRCLDRRRRQ